MEFLKILMFLFFTSISYKVQSEDLTLEEHTNSSSSKNYSFENVGKETPYNLMDPQEVKRLSKQYEKLPDKLFHMSLCFGYPVYQLLKKICLDSHFDAFSTICILSSVIGGVELADALTGIEHAFLDSIDEENPIYPEIVRWTSSSFKVHHIYPKQVTEISYWFLTRPSCQKNLIILPFLIYLNSLSYTNFSILMDVAFLTVPQVQYIHACAHGKKAAYPWLQNLIKWCQDHNILLNWNTHKAHHIGEHKYEQNFCGITGHTNVILNPLIKAVKYISNIKIIRLFCGRKNKET